MKYRNSTDKIIIHCADTYAEQDIGAAEIDQWHKQQGWDGIGYHKVIRRDGTIEDGRPLGAQGAHAKGYNSTTIGVCMVGGRGADGKPENNFTPAQWKALKDVVAMINGLYLGLTVIGHRDVDKKKACPCFDAKKWAEQNGFK